MLKRAHGCRGMWVGFFVLGVAAMAVPGAIEGVGQPVHELAAREVEVSFAGAGELALSGALLLPGGGGSHPAVLLLPGSGPTDRDGNQHPVLVTDLLKQIAERLASEGVASLRFDKRATRHYASRWPRDPAQLDEFFSWENFVGDAGGALEFLCNHAEIDGGLIAIIGHSEGGLIALQLGHDLAGTEKTPVGLVLLATAGRTLDIVVREQIAASLERSNASEALTMRLAGEADAAIKAVKAGEPLPEKLSPELRPLFNPTVLKLLRAYFTIDPTQLARAFVGPVLIVQGEEDLQVSATRDAARLDTALRQRHNGLTELVLIPGASHNLKPLAVDPHGFRGPIAEPAAKAISAWAAAHLKHIDAPERPNGVDGEDPPR